MTEIRFYKLRLKFHNLLVMITLLILLILLAALYFQSKQVINLPENIVAFMNKILVIISTLFFISLVLRLTLKRVHKMFDEPEEKIFYTKIYSWALYTIGIFVLLNQMGVSPGNITLFIGLIATGLAFAVRDVLLSFFGWMVLLLKKPFRIGDYIRIGEDEGKVLHIGTFYVLIDKTSDLTEDYTRVPNRLFLEKSINNLGKIHIQEIIILQLSGMPANYKELEAELKNDIESFMEEKGNLNVYIDVRNEKLCLLVEYLVNFENKQKFRSEIIGLIFSKMYEYITVPRIL